ncbi:MAG TPA: hypothetical protein VK165_10675 [Azonexus sp.]|nr:hypothetical protein [Azonexus sp.]
MSKMRGKKGRARERLEGGGRSAEIREYVDTIAKSDAVLKSSARLLKKMEFRNARATENQKRTCDIHLQASQGTISHEEAEQLLVELEQREELLRAQEEREEKIASIFDGFLVPVKSAIYLGASVFFRGMATFALYVALVCLVIFVLIPWFFHT